MQHRNPLALTRAKSLRKRQTWAEVLLWQKLRNRRLVGRKFRRQASIGKYIVDFLCVEARLIIELDGSVHATRQRYDEKRDRFLRSLGYTILRIQNHALEESMDETLGMIVEMLEALKPSPKPSPHPSLSKGGGAGEL